MGVVSIWAALAATVVSPPQEAPRAWQQGVEYRIEARLDEEPGVLEGRGRIRYRNDSPDTLTTFYLHLYLNAFRPNSAWARRDLEFGIRTFQDLSSEDQGFERIRELTVDERPVRLRYPNAPDSTVVAMDLPQPLEPGRSLTIDVRWDSRPSTVPRRQGRRGRHFDFAQWYPRVAVYDDEGWRPHPLVRSGEFYSEFATFDVTLDLAEDQVMGATGVPVEGEPGWARAAVPGTGPIDYQRAWYGTQDGPPCVERGGERVCGTYPARRLRPAEALDLLGPEPAAGRKRVRWYAENVHHFAWSTSPDYIYEQGAFDGAVIRVLYRPGDEGQWGGGQAVRRTAVALQWLDSIFGPYPYPQVTNLHRLEGGGTEFPMMVMNGSASQGLILHEVGHIYAFGILANNEWYEGWLDEGMTSFQTAWFNERAGGGPGQWVGSRASTILNDVTGVSEPVVLRAEDYAEHGVYNAMIYTKGSVILWMLRELVGDDTMVRILRTWYQRYQFRHVDSQAFQEVAEEVSGRDLDWFFGQWLHAVGVVDYALDDVHVDGAPEEWVTRLRLRRLGDVRMPVPVRVSGRGGEVLDTVLDGNALASRSVLRTTFEPDVIRLDPRGTILDWNPSNDAWGRGVSLPAYDFQLDDPTRPLPLRLDRVPVGIFPLAWVNDAGGWVAGVQMRQSLLGLSTSVVRLGLPAIPLGDRGDTGRGWDAGSLYLRSQGPVLGDRPRPGLGFEAFAGEGRYLLSASAEKDLRAHPLSGSDRAVRIFATVAGVDDPAYLVPGRWTPARKVSGEMGFGGRLRADLLGLAWNLDATGAGGFDTGDHRWLRGTVRADGDRPLGAGWTLRSHLFAGGAVGADQAEADTRWNGDRVPAERRFFLSSADPWSTVGNPWIRSAGSALDDRGWVAGGGVLRGFDPTVSLAWLVSADLEVAAPGLALGGPRGLRLRPLAFGGIGTGAQPGLPLLLPLAPGTDDSVEDRLPARTLLWSAGVGLELARPGSPFRLRVDVPVLISHPELAVDARENRAGFRVQVGFAGW